MNDCQEELLDIVDFDDRVLGVATRGRIHNGYLWHRSVHILVINTNGHIYVQRRALHKECSPGLWDSSAAGHVIHCESYYAAAMRELNEELGLNRVVLEPFCRLPATDVTGFEFVRAYLCKTEREPIPDPDEIAATEWHTVDHLQSLVEFQPMRFTGTFKLIFAQYVGLHGSGNRR